MNSIKTRKTLETIALMAAIAMITAISFMGLTGQQAQAQLELPEELAEGLDSVGLSWLVEDLQDIVDNVEIPPGSATG